MVKCGSKFYTYIFVTRKFILIHKVKCDKMVALVPYIWVDPGS